jgi:hypothetical protein
VVDGQGHGLRVRRVAGESTRTFRNWRAMAEEATESGRGCGPLLTW